MSNVMSGLLRPGECFSSVDVRLWQKKKIEKMFENLFDKIYNSSNQVWETLHYLSFFVAHLQTTPWMQLLMASKVD